ncbi:WXG100-like domain-containing protein [Nocardia heshunensis]
MSIDIPGELQWLGWVAGSAWPQGDEDKMWGIAEDWRHAARQLRDLLPELEAAKQATEDAYPWGDGLEAMTSALNKLDSGPQSFEALAEILDQVAGAADGLGTEIEYTKIMVLSSLAMLAVEIALAWCFPPTAPAEEAAATVWTRLAVRLLGERAVSAIARYAEQLGVAAVARFLAKHVVMSTVLGTGQDVAIQGLQIAEGHRKSMDWDRVGMTALTAAGAGAAGGPAGEILGKAGSHLPFAGNRFGNAARGALVGTGAGIAGAFASWGVGGLPTLLTKGTTDGWTWDPRLLTSATSFGVLTGGSKGFRLPTESSVHPTAFEAPTGARTTMPTGGDGSAPPPHPTPEAPSHPSATPDPAGTQHPQAAPEPTSHGGGPAGAESTSRPGGSAGAEANSRAGSPAAAESGSRAGNSSGVETTGRGANPATSEPGSRPSVDPSNPSRPATGGPVAESRSGAPGSGDGSAPVPVGKPEQVNPVEHPAQASAGGDGRTGAEPVAGHEPGGNPAAGSRSPAETALDSVRGHVRSLGVDPEGMSPEQLRRAGMNAVVRRLSELEGEYEQLNQRGLGPAEHFAIKAQLDQRMQDLLGTRKQLTDDFGRYRDAAAAPPRPGPEPPRAVDPRQTPASPEPTAATSKPETAAGSVPESLREQMRSLGVDPDGLNPEQLKRAGLEAVVRRMSELDGDYGRLIDDFGRFTEKFDGEAGASTHGEESTTPKQPTEGENSEAPRRPTQALDPRLTWRLPVEGEGSTPQPQRPAGQVDPRLAWRLPAEGEESTPESPGPVRGPDPRLAWRLPVEGEGATSELGGSHQMQDPRLTWRLPPEGESPAPVSGGHGPGPDPRLGWRLPPGGEDPTLELPRQHHDEDPPDTTSMIPYTPRYFSIPPIPEYTAPAPPPDSVWEPDHPPAPAPPPHPPNPEPPHPPGHGHGPGNGHGSGHGHSPGHGSGHVDNPGRGRGPGERGHNPGHGRGPGAPGHHPGSGSGHGGGHGHEGGGASRAGQGPDGSGLPPEE